jgi:hypothetical protein
MLTTIYVGTVTTREDVERLLLAVEAQELLSDGAHQRTDPLADEAHGRVVLSSIARKELRERAAPTLRVRWAR